MNNLTNKITNILAQLGHPNPAFWISDPILCNTTLSERQSVNRYWRQYLGNLNVDTSEGRFCLNDNEQESSYLFYFKTKVAPLIIGT
jgi:hypothetical protein